MDAIAASAFFKTAQDYVIGVAIGLPRITALFMVMPVFTRIGLTGIVRAGIGIAFVLPLLPYLVASVPPASVNFALVAPMLLKETMVGVLLGLVLGVPIWTAEVAGEILDVQRGATFAEMTDPLSTGNNNITGTFLSIVVVGLYFTSGGLGITLKALYESYNLWPLQGLTPILSQDSGLLLLKLLDEIMSMGLMLVIPIVVSLLLADLSLALVARAAPHLNIFVLSLTVKNFTLALFLVLYGSFMMTYMRGDLASIVDFANKLQPFAPR